MVVTGSIDKVREVIREARKKGKIVGFVPTMGALHEGHLSLIKAARRDSSFVVVSIFVNPTQFGPKEDYRSYPRNFKKDIELVKKEKIDLLFYPPAKVIYPDGFSTYISETCLSRALCGKSRPGHFIGVCTVVAKLFNIIEPDIAYFGQKDYQQARIIKKITKDLNFPTKIKVLPIVRERDGLAMSSRNIYLNSKEREVARCLYSAINLAKKLIKKGERNSRKVISKMEELMKSKKRVEIDYIEIVDADELNDLKRIGGRALIALAVYVGKTRLIDNIIVNVK